MRTSSLKSTFIICILFTISLVAYHNLTRRIGRPPLLWVRVTTATSCANLSRDDGPTPTSLSHLVFSVAGSASTWELRRRYSNLWWAPNSTRGFVWLDEFPPVRLSSWDATPQPLRVIRFDPERDRTGSGRIASIVKAAFDAEEGGEEEVRWFVMGDDDTVFFKENLVTVLSRYDHRQMWYIGDVSESVEQNVMHSYRTAYGGGGFAISRPLACQLARAMDGCLQRYASYYGSDEKISACIAELGVALTRESGFHQLDIRGDPYGLLAAHPLAPLVSLHHIEAVEPLFPHLTKLASLERLHRSYQLDPPRILQQSMCYSRTLNWSVSVSWGYSVQLYPNAIVVPREMELALQTFKTWHTGRDGPFEFNTRPACGPNRPVLYFLDDVVETSGRKGTLGSYKRTVVVEKGNVSSCQHSTPYNKEVVASVDVITVVASKMNPAEWLKVCAFII
ncbi:hypothetical protein V2J09_022157 [Rumex salicifolius]